MQALVVVDIRSLPSTFSSQEGADSLRFVGDTSTYIGE